MCDWCVSGVNNVMVDLGAEIASPLSSAHSETYLAWAERVSAAGGILGPDMESVKSSAYEVDNKPDWG